MVVLFVLLSALLGAHAQPCGSYTELVAPQTITQTAPFTTRCWKITSVNTYQFTEYNIANPSWDYFYFFNDARDYSTASNPTNYTQGQSITTLLSYPFSTGNLFIYFYTSSGTSTANWTLQINAIPTNGAACTTTPMTAAPTQYGYMGLDKGSCNPSGGTASGNKCQLTCDAPKTLYSMANTQYYTTEAICNNGVWGLIKYPSFCYSTDCIGNLVNTSYSDDGYSWDDDAYNGANCQGRTFKSGDTCSVSCKTNYVNYPGYLPAFVRCANEYWGSPNVQHGRWKLPSFADGVSSYCFAPCLELPDEARFPTSHPEYASGDCQAGAGIHSGSTCNLACASGYVKQGSLQRVCTNGDWSAPNGVYGSCEAPCTAQPVRTNMVAGCTISAPSRSSCTLTCAANYIASGDLTVTCVNGAWPASNNPTGTCLAPCLTAPTNPANGTYSCSPPFTSGFQCPLTCNSPTVPSVAYAKCTNGGWNSGSITCDEYYWYNTSWSMCRSEAATCVAGLASSNGNAGTQSRNVYCRNKRTQSSAVDALCKNFGTKPDYTQVCTVVCPEVPTILTVKPYNGAVYITVKVIDFDQYADDTYLSISYCQGTRTGGGCTFDGKEVFGTSRTYIGYDSGFGGYNGTNGRIISVFYPNLTNGVSLSFRAAYETTVNGGNQWYQSQYSAASSSVILSGDDTQCYGGCVYGVCLMGYCSCKPGAYSDPGWSNCTNPAVLDKPYFPTSPYTPTVSDSVTVSWDTTLDYVHVFLFPESCRGNLQCVPAWGKRFVAGGSTTINTCDGVCRSFEKGKPYFVRVFYTAQRYNESESFQFSDPLCDAAGCQNGGVCYYGTCYCTKDWKNKTCNVPKTECEKSGLDCGRWGNCTGSSCRCADGWSGDECQYPPGCNIRCQHHGTPNDVNLLLDKGNSYGCAYCECPSNWGGRTCDQCNIKCFNGGWTDGDCFGCECPTWYTGSRCEKKYWIASFKVKLSAPNLDLNKEDDIEVFENAVVQDLTSSFDINVQWEAQAKLVGDRMTVWIVAGPKSTVVRDNIYRTITGNNYWTDDSLRYQSTLTGGAIQASSWEQQDPPNAGGLTTPSLLLTVIILLLGIMMN